MNNISKAQPVRKSDAAVVFWALQKAWEICPGKLIFWVLVNLVSAIFTPVYLLLSSHLIDTVTQVAGTGGAVWPFVLPVALMALFLFLRSSYRLLANVTKQIFIKDMQLEVSRSIMAQCARIPVAAFDDTEFIKMLYLCANSENTANTAVLAQGSVTVLGQVVSMGALLAMAARISWVFFAGTLALAIVSLMVCVHIARERYRIEKDTIVDTRWKNYYFSIPCTQENGREIRTLGLEGRFVKKWRSVADPLRGQLLGAEYAKNNGNKLIDLLSALLAAGMLAGGLFFLNGGMITMGTMYLIWQLNTEIQSGVRSFVDEFQEPYASIPKVRDTQEFLDLEFGPTRALGGPSIPAPAALPQTKQGEALFCLKNVSFGYKPEKEILHQLSLSIQKGEIVALCGLNGSGKSTLINLLTGMYKPQSGSCSLCGVPYAALSAKTLAGYAGVAFQDFCVYGFSLKEEVGMGEVEELPQEKKVLRAIHRGGAEKLAARVGMDSFMGTAFDVSGYRLSGGEYQRIGVSRAFMGDKPILILDEPAAMLDPIAEYRQFQEIKQQIAGQTAILISHRIGFARLADRILVMDQGRIVEDGSHGQLMAQNGLYRKMFDTQSQWYDDVSGEAERHV